MTQDLTPEALINALGLEPHPEGGAFSEIYRCALRTADRHLATSIYFLLRPGEVSAWHRVAHDELWFYHGGSPLRLKGISKDGKHTETLLGLDVLNGERPQGLIPAGDWQAAVPLDPTGWTLVSCVVTPGFDFADFELSDVPAMRERFPHLNHELALKPEDVLDRA